MTLGFKKKKANVILDGLLLLVILFSFSLLALFIKPVFSEMNQDIQNDPDIDPIGKQRIDDLNSRYTPVFDGAVIAILITLWIGSIITSLFIDTHPIFFAIIILLSISVLFIAAILANTYDDSLSGSEYDTVRSDFKSIEFIMTHLVEIVIFFVGTVGFAMFVKMKAIG